MVVSYLLAGSSFLGDGVADPVAGAAAGRAVTYAESYGGAFLDGADELAARLAEGGPSWQAAANAQVLGLVELVADDARGHLKSLDLAESSALAEALARLDAVVANAAAAIAASDAAGRTVGPAHPAIGGRAADVAAALAAATRQASA